MTCARCHKPYTFYSGIPDVCLVCVRNGAEKLLNDVMNIEWKKIEGYDNSADFSAEVREAERILAGKEGK